MKLYTFEYVANNMGVWSREWFGTKREAVSARRARIAAFGAHAIVDNGEQYGQYGEVTWVEMVRVLPTRAGILEFVRNYAEG